LGREQDQRKEKPEEWPLSTPSILFSLIARPGRCSVPWRKPILSQKVRKYRIYVIPRWGKDEELGDRK
jgi:hypothetical protein